MAPDHEPRDDGYRQRDARTEQLGAEKRVIGQEAEMTERELPRRVEREEPARDRGPKGQRTHRTRADGRGGLIRHGR